MRAADGKQEINLEWPYRNRYHSWFLFCLPSEKLDRLKGMLKEWSDRKVCTRGELESLVGSPNHACKVVRPRRSFIRRMLDFLRWSSAGSAQWPHHYICLHREFQSDLQWWRNFIGGWNGVSVWKEREPSIKVVSDGSGAGVLVNGVEPLV